MRPLRGRVNGRFSSRNWLPGVKLEQPERVATADFLALGISQTQPRGQVAMIVGTAEIGAIQQVVDADYLDHATTQPWRMHVEVKVDVG